MQLDKADAGRERRYAWALAVDPADPERWFVSAAPGPFEAHGSRPSDSAIYRWEGSGPWQIIDAPRDSHVYALATGPEQLFAGLGDGTLLQTEDGGESWTELGERTGGITALAVNEVATTGDLSVKDRGPERSRSLAKSLSETAAFRALR